MDRAKKYESHSDIAKKLLNYLYDDYDEYLNTEYIHPFENYIFQFDLNLGYPDTIELISSRLGILTETPNDRLDMIQMFVVNLQSLINVIKANDIDPNEYMDQDDFDRGLILIKQHNA